ncbi:MAG: hypothetical protein ABIR30_09140 [Chitinophagaceae bacterium]
MRKLLFVLLFIPAIAGAQQDKEGNNLFLRKTDSSCRFISLPPLWRSDLTKVYEVGGKSSYQYIINHDSVYYRIFSRYSKDSLPVFDFSKQELLVRISCSYCIGMMAMNREPAHRNACSYNDSWCLRDKKEIVVK